MNPFRTPLDPPPKARPLPFRPAQRPDLTVEQILGWCDAFQKRFSRWPTYKDGPRCLPDTTWNAIDTCLRLGYRGLKRGSSLAKLLLVHRGKRHKGCLPRLTQALILQWADDHHTRTGRWPNKDSGPILAAPGETWVGVESALRAGCRGWRKPCSLAQLLAAKRGVRNHKALPRLTTKQILAWADRHHAQTGDWPTAESGAVKGASSETWIVVDNALRAGIRGLPGGSSLAKLLFECRGRHHRGLPAPITIEQILGWADAHRQRTGQWPSSHSSEPIPNAPEELTWIAVNGALRSGRRGLAGGSSLAEFLETHRGVRNQRSVPKLTKAQILVWADDYYRRTGKWPKHISGPIAASPGETWAAVESALTKGQRGLPGGDSLARLLCRRRGVRNPATLPQLTEKQIGIWAAAHRKRTGRWPTVDSGAVREVPGETWSGVNRALTVGGRGLPGGDSLARLLARRFGKRNHKALPPLSIEQIQRWIRVHYRRTGCWPKQEDGPIPDTHGDTWAAVAAALSNGRRGLPGGSSLTRLVEACQKCRRRS